ncbi:golgin subfamily A member 1 isoform X2 [Brachyhypopomus gauderio]|uniref:golgin subfamily A member 1 isoform X2 n=1 Tax=Brachyhypopomus gauderio TaxID=698409 RepID=UPI00404367D7
MFKKLKKKIAEEVATAPRSGRIPRSMSKESITSVGADSGDDFASDGSSSRDDLSSQILRRNDQIRKLEAKLSASMRKLQEQNESFQANRAKMAEGMALALEKKDQEWREKMAVLEQEKTSLTARLEQSLNLFQKRDEQDELEGFQIQELAKVKHMLLQKEELLSRRERELKQRGEELNTARRDLSQTQDKLYELGEEHEELRGHRDELLGEKEEAERRVSDLEAREQELQQLIQQVSEDFQKAQSVARSVQKSLDSLQTEHSELKLQHEQHKSKAAVMAEERERLLANLQEKARSLERRLEANFSQDEHLNELLKEKSSLEQRLEEVRAEFVEERANHTAAVNSLQTQKSSLEQRLQEVRAELEEERTNHTAAVCSLQTQISKQNSSLFELQTLLRHKDDSSRSYRERTDVQIAELEQRLADSAHRLAGLEQQVEETEADRNRLQVEWEERERLHHQVSTQRQRGLEKVAKMEEELLTLQQERDTQIRAHQDSRRLWEDEKVCMLKSRAEMESAMEKLTAELEHARTELSSRHTVSVEIAKALEETRKQREELQQQVGEMSASLQKAEQEMRELTEQVAKKEAELSGLREDLQAACSSLSSLQAELEELRVQAEEREREAQITAPPQEPLPQITAPPQEPLPQITAPPQLDEPDSSPAKVCELQGEVDSLALQLREAEVCVNGAVTMGDLDQLQNTNKELEQQLSEKNKTIKQLQQRLAELKRTLQKELKLKPDTDSENKDKLQESRAERPHDRPSAEAPVPAAAATPAPGSTQGMIPATHSSKTRVTNSSDLMDTREINFEYLKHVLLRFMSSKETEAYQLIRAVSVLLHFTREEEDMLKQTLEYKMSWFGSKPAPKGIIRPSISGAPSGWS